MIASPPQNPSQPPQPGDRRLVASISRTEVNWSGPIPPPEVLEKYNAILPGMAERILAMAEKQSNHRQDLEKKVIGADVIKSYLGMIFALIIVLAGIVAAVWIAIYGNSANSKLLAGFIVAFDFGTIGLIALGNKKAQERQLEERKKAALAPPQ